MHRNRHAQALGKPHHGSGLRLQLGGLPCHQIPLHGGGSPCGYGLILPPYLLQMLSGQRYAGSLAYGYSLCCGSEKQRAMLFILQKLIHRRSVIGPHSTKGLDKEELFPKGQFYVGGRLNDDTSLLQHRYQIV